MSKSLISVSLNRIADLNFALNVKGNKKFNPTGLYGEGDGLVAVCTENLIIQATVLFHRIYQNGVFIFMNLLCLK